jgi:hypothetical protein
MAGTAREEAERLVATVLAMASQSGPGDPANGEKANDDTLSGTAHRVTEGLGALGETLAGVVGQLTGASSANRGTTGGPAEGPAAGDHRGGAWATGSPECCVCPLCKVIAGMRDPTPQTAARLAGGAGDFASGVASLMRAVSAMSSNPRPKPARPARPAPPTPDEAWQTATRVPDPSGRHKAPVAAEPTVAEPTVAEPSSEGAAGKPAAEAATTEGATAAQPGRDEARSAALPPVGTDPWSAASRADAASTAADQRAKAARKAAEAARKIAEAEAARVAARAAAARAAAEAQAARQAAEAARQAATTEAAGEPRGVDHEPSVGAGDPRIENGFDTSEGDRRSPAGPAAKYRGDVWAAATGESRVAPRRNVDHDVAGPAADADPAAGQSEAAGDV